MRHLLVTTALMVPLGLGQAVAQEAEEPAEEGEQVEVQVIEPEVVESSEAEEAVEGAEGAVQEAGEAVGEAAEEAGEAVEGAAEEVEAEVQPEAEGAAEPAEGGAEEVVVREQAQNELRVDWITDATLRSPEGETVGGIEDLILDGDTGQLSAVIVGVGGFLGIGQKSIAVAWDQLQIDYDANEVTANLTRDEAEAAPEYVFREQEAPPPPEPAMDPATDPDAGVEPAPIAPAPAGD